MIVQFLSNLKDHVSNETNIYFKQILNLALRSTQQETFVLAFGGNSSWGGLEGIVVG